MRTSNLTQHHPRFPRDSHSHQTIHFVGEHLGDGDVLPCHRCLHRLLVRDPKRRSNTWTQTSGTGTHYSVHDAGRPLPVHPLPDHRRVFLPGYFTPLVHHAHPNTGSRPGAEHEPDYPSAGRVEEAM